MKTIGITGGVGSGKSLVLDYLKERYGAAVIVADRLAHELEQPGEACYSKLVEEFGENILDENRYIDKIRFAAMIFSDKEALEKTNEIIHPAVKEEILKRISLEEEAGTELFVVEAALLIEEGYDKILSELWYIHAKNSVRRRRLKESRGYSEEKIDSIMAQQKSEEEFRQSCRRIIDNSEDTGSTYAQIDRIMEELGIKSSPI
ncbi:MAG: dephospho-CoA kinase [Lachnospiraceae bacterium]|nr:dephospho-CoA kinase [Lachnospiraceae bacterium]